jgi:hypothetical protein
VQYLVYALLFDVLENRFKGRKVAMDIREDSALHLNSPHPLYW